MKKFVTLFACMFFMVAMATAQENLELYVNSPAALAGQYEVGPPADDFGGNLAPGESITGDLAMVMDTIVGNDTLSQQGCFSLVNGAEVTGKIALIRRGSCFFSDKVWNAQEAGAIGAIICNSNPGEGVITMGSGGDYAGLATIPSGFMSYEDCELLIQELGAGGSASITMTVPAFYGNIAAYSYHTPVEQIVPLDQIQVNLVNSSGMDQTDVTVSVDITDPNSNTTTLTTTIADFPAGLDSLVTFDEYVPTEDLTGEYTAIFTNSLTSDVLSSGFVITDMMWAPDNGVIDGAAGPSDEQFALADSYKYHAGSLCLPGSQGAFATHVSFGISNGADVFLGDPAFDFISVILYDADANEDNTLDWAATGAAFDDLSAVGLGNYPLTGTETADDPLIMVPLLEIASGAGVVSMKPDGAYYASIQYDGQAGLATVAPAFVTTDDVPYLNFPTTPIFIDVLYTGWAGEIVVCRLHTDPSLIVDNVEDITMLDEDKISISPNPASDFVNLQLDLVDVADQVRVDIINYDGKIVETRVFDNVQNNNFEFNVSDFPAGHYFFSVKTPEGYNNTAVHISH